MNISNRTIQGGFYGRQVLTWIGLSTMDQHVRLPSWSIPKTVTEVPLNWYVPEDVHIQHLYVLYGDRVSSYHVLVFLSLNPRFSWFNRSRSSWHEQQISMKLNFLQFSVRRPPWGVEKNRVVGMQDIIFLTIWCGKSEFFLGGKIYLVGKKWAGTGV